MSEKLRLWSWNSPEINVLASPPSAETISIWRQTLIKRSVLSMVILLLSLGAVLFLSEQPVFRQVISFSYGSSGWALMLWFLVMFSAMTYVVFAMSLYVLALKSALNSYFLKNTLSLDSEKLTRPNQLKSDAEDEGIVAFCLLRCAQLPEVKAYLLDVKRTGRQLTVFEYHAIGDWFGKRDERDKEKAIEEAKKSLLELLN